MNTNDKLTPEKDNPTPCDLETVVTAQITLIDRGVEIGADFDALALAEGVKIGVKSYLNNFAGRLGLDDEHIKVQVFIHEKVKDGETDEDR